MNASLVGVTQGAQPAGDLVAQAEDWNRRLRAYREATAEVFRGASPHLRPGAPGVD